MLATRKIQFAAAAALLVGGAFVARKADAQNGICRIFRSPDIQPCVGASWGQSCNFGPGNNYVLTGISQGTFWMMVNLGDSTYSCVEATGDYFELTGQCTNHDDTNDGSSVYDGTGDCTPSATFTVNTWLSPPH